MFIPDFLVYYGTRWFDKNKAKLNGTSPVENATYIATIATILWLICIWEVIDIFVLKSKSAHQIPMIPGVIIGLSVMQLYKYIYVNKGRYERISALNKKFKLSDKLGLILSMIFVFVLCCMIFAMIMIFT